MDSTKHPFQKWIEDSGVIDVRFYPNNPNTSSASDLLDSAFEAITRYEAGHFVPYEDNVAEHFV